MLHRYLPFVVAVVLLGGCGRDTKSDSAPSALESSPWFEDVTSPMGVDVRHDNGWSGRFAISEIMGAGVALFDANGDGRTDLLALGGGSDGSRHRLFLQDASGTFRTAQDSGLEHPGCGMGVAVGDIDGDGDLDVYLGHQGPDALMRNDGNGRFTDISTSAGLADGGWTTSVTFLDCDGDGDLDIWAARYLVEDPGKTCVVGGRRDYCAPAAYEPTADVLLRNLGDGRFEDISREAGIATTVRHGLGVVATDFDGDGDVDVYVANDGDANSLWINDGRGHFTDDAMLAGLALNGMGEAEASMGIALGDLNNDGRVDLFATHVARQSNTLYLSTGSGAWVDATARTGLAAVSRPFTGFGTEFADLDNDGDLDLVVVNGRVAREDSTRESTAATFTQDYGERDVVLENVDGRFREVPGWDGPANGHGDVGRGLAVLDLDGDGGLDLVVTNNGGPLRILRNEVPRRGNWLAVRAVEPESGRILTTSHVTVTSGDLRLRRSALSERSYLTSVEPIVHFGLGPRDAVDHIDITWPGGQRERFPGGAVNRVVTLVRGEGR